MSAHTPGPWHVGGPTGFINQIAICPSIGCAYGKGDELQANARLIAAAPDLLAALEVIAAHSADEWISHGSDCAGINRVRVIIHGAARAAIAKAKGEA